MRSLQEQIDACNTADADSRGRLEFESQRLLMQYWRVTGPAKAPGVIDFVKKLLVQVNLCCLHINS